MKKILVIFGTRPEAIKMMPLIREFQNYKDQFDLTILSTGQHDEMLSETLESLDISVDINLKLMKKSQTLFNISISILERMSKLMDELRPDIVFVHGDTTTSFISALSAYYKKIKIAHVEAGLRTFDIFSPYPEEFNRQAISLIADYHFAPTKKNQDNLLKIGVSSEKIMVTGNTSIDALQYTIKKEYKHEILDWVKNSKLILITMHRRETSYDKMEKILVSLNNDIFQNSDYKVVFPVHMNPQIKELATRVFKNSNNVKLVKPLKVVDFHNIMSRAYIVITDSGGIQEEAPSLNIPVFVLRNKTERTEGLKAGTLVLCGTEEKKIVRKLKNYLESSKMMDKIRESINPYGDGKASKKIVKFLLGSFYN